MQKLSLSVRVQIIKNMMVLCSRQLMEFFDMKICKTES